MSDEDEPVIFRLCDKCEGMILLNEEFCITCLLEQTKKLIEDSENTFKTW